MNETIECKEVGMYELVSGSVTTIFEIHSLAPICVANISVCVGFAFSMEKHDFTSIKMISSINFGPLHIT